MVNQLNGLVSGKLRKPIIFNGKLLRDGDNIITVRRENYRVVMTAVGFGGSETIISDGDALLNAEADAFNSKYSILSSGSEEELNQFSPTVDFFTGAIVIKNGLYEKLIDRYDEMHFHDGKRQFQEETQKRIDTFTEELLMNYFDIYLHLLNKRLTASHMPQKIKGHLVAGLFQPIVVRTKQIDSPFQLGEFQWFHELLNNPEMCEIRLEGVQETTRGLELTVISMYDFSQKMNVSCAKELNKLYFQFILCRLLLSTLNSEGPDMMEQRYGRIYNKIAKGLGDTHGAMQFLTECDDSLIKLATRLSARN